MAVEADRSATGAMLVGVTTMQTTAGLAALRELLEADATRAAVMPIDWSALVKAYPAFAADTFLESQVGAVRHDPSGGDPGARATPASLDGASPEDRARLVQSYLHTEAARIMGFTPARLDSQAPLSSFGFDSLMAVQLKNRVEAGLGLVIPLIEFLQGPSVAELVPVLLGAAAENAGNPGTLATTEAEEDTWEVGSL